jgi:AcrR family transcriptional regulator
MARTKPSVKPAYHHGDLRNVLVARALDLFAERGSFAFSMSELARAAGVTHNAPYRHFRSKGELLAAVRAEGLAKLGELATHALEQADADPRARVRALGEAYVRFAVDYPHHFRLVLHNPLERPESDPSARGGAYQLLERCLEEGRKAGAVRRDRSARELALVAWSLVHGLASLLVTGQLPAGRPRLAHYTSLLDEVFFEGVGA